MKFLCDNLLCGEVYYIDDNLDEDGCLKCPTCGGTSFIVKSIEVVKK